MVSEPHFANVQFEFKSDQDLSSLVDFLGNRVSIHYDGPWESISNFVSLSLVNSGVEGDGGPEMLISTFCDLIQSMPEEVKRTWDRCVDKRFDIGFESGESGKELNTLITNEALKRVGSVGADLVITLYPVRS